MNFEDILTGKIIKAIDRPDEEDALDIASKFENIEEVGAIKIGLPLILSSNLSIIRKIKKTSQKPVILDLKISDIPTISSNIIEQAIKLGCDAVTIQGFVGKKVIQDCVNVCIDSKLFILVVTGMTHEDDENGLTNLHAEEIAKWALESEAHGIIVPGNKIDQIKVIKDIVNNEITIIATGFGATEKGGQGGKIELAEKAGAKFFIQGTLYNPPEPEESLKDNFVKEIKFYSLIGSLILLIGSGFCKVFYPNIFIQVLIGILIAWIFSILYTCNEYRKKKDAT